MRALSKAAAAAFVALGLLGSSKLARAAACEDLVRVGRSLESTGDVDHALRAYTDAINLDPTCRDAYLRLGAIRESRHDFREAERVYAMATEHVPTARDVHLRHATVLLHLGREAEGLADLRLLGERDPEDEGAFRIALEALHKLDDWFVAHDSVAARLGVWRRLSVLGERTGDAALLGQARGMVRALTLVVATADPVTSPNGAAGLRPIIAKTAR